MQALALNCTLKPSPMESNCELLLGELLKEMSEHGVESEIVRAVDLNIKPGVISDKGEGDNWAALRERTLDADVFVLGTPIWLGHPASVGQRVLERLDAFLGEQDERGGGRPVPRPARFPRRPRLARRLDELADVEAAKSEPDLVRSALQKAGGRASEAVLVGDSPYDVESAERASVPTVAVLTGGFSEAEPSDTGAREVYESVAKLWERMERWTS